MADGSAELDPSRATSPDRPARIYYGWFIVAAAFLTSFTSLGIVYTSSTFFTSLSRTFGASSAAISGILAVTLFSKAIFGAGAGRIADRIGPRPVVAAAGIAVCISLLLASRTAAVWQLYITYGLGVGLAAGALYVTGLDAVDRWFERRRVEATGFALTGVAIGNLLLPPLAATLILLAGWRTTFVLLGLGALLLVLIAALLLSPSPAARGVPAEDRAPTGARAIASRSMDWTVGEARRSRSFWLLYGAILFAALAYYVPFTGLVPDAEVRGIHPVVAAVLLGLIGAGSLVARLLAGISDHGSRRRAWAASFALMAVMFVWWFAAGSVWALAIFAIGFGLGGGIFFTLISPLAADYFGTLHAGALVGILLTALAPGSLLSPILAGFAFDQLHSYALPIALGALANLVALGCVLVLRDPEPARRAAPGASGPAT